MIDTTDKKYQISETFKPDKESTWKYPPSNDGWVHAHNALRGEISYFRMALEATEKRGTPLKGWEVQAILSAASAHFEHIHGHHSNEDDIFVPELRKRFLFPEKLEADHIGIVEKLALLEGIVKNLKEGDRLEQVRLREEWVEYESIVLPHLLEEEQVGLPLMRAYFTPNEIEPITQKLVARLSKNELGSFIYFMGQERLRKEFMKQENIPWFVWYLDFKGKLKHFEKTFALPINELIAGQHNEPKAGWFNLL